MVQPLEGQCGRVELRDGVQVVSTQLHRLERRLRTAMVIGADQQGVIGIGAVPEVLLEVLQGRIWPSS